MGQFIIEYLVNKYNVKVVVFGFYVFESVVVLEKVGKIYVVRGDVIKLEVRDEVMKVVKKYFGGLDFFVIIMGVMGEIEKFGKLDMEKMWRIFEIDVFVFMVMVSRSILRFEFLKVDKYVVELRIFFYVERKQW